MNTYKAEYNDGEMEVFSSDTDKNAYQEALSYEKEHDILIQLDLLDNDYNVVKTIF